MRWGGCDYVPFICRYIVIICLGIAVHLLYVCTLLYVYVGIAVHDLSIVGCGVGLHAGAAVHLSSIGALLHVCADSPTFFLYIVNCYASTSA